MTTSKSNDIEDNKIKSNDEFIDKSINVDFFTEDLDKIDVNESTRTKILEEIEQFCKSRNVKFIEDLDYWSIKYKLESNKCIFYCVYSDFDNNRIYLIYEQKFGSSNLRLTYSAIRDKKYSLNKEDENEDENNDTFNVIIKFLVNIFQWAIKRIVSFLYNALKNLLAQFDIKLNLDSIIKYLEETDSESNKSDINVSKE